ncbi:MAG: hypothetical protein J6X06_00900 [Elusimicrobiaceae bacterium]|nr:hypothetical protein [Elusimicrobiaceae bacterium]
MNLTQIKKISVVAVSTLFIFAGLSPAFGQKLKRVPKKKAVVKTEGARLHTSARSPRAKPQFPVSTTSRIHTATQINRVAQMAPTKFTPIQLNIPQTSVWGEKALQKAQEAAVRQVLDTYAPTWKQDILFANNVAPYSELQEIYPQRVVQALLRTEKHFEQTGLPLTLGEYEKTFQMLLLETSSKRFVINVMQTIPMQSFFKLRAPDVQPQPVTIAEKPVRFKSDGPLDPNALEVLQSRADDLRALLTGISHSSVEGTSAPVSYPFGKIYKQTVSVLNLLERIEAHEIKEGLHQHTKNTTPYIRLMEQTLLTLSNRLENLITAHDTYSFKLSTHPNVKVNHTNWVTASNSLERQSKQLAEVIERISQIYRGKRLYDALGRARQVVRDAKTAQQRGLNKHGAQ